MSQFLDRIKFGDGHDGSPGTLSGTINTYASCTGTAAATSLTTTLAANAGDIILIHQSQGTGAGQWELNEVSADAGATLTLNYPLAYTYGTGAQAVLVPQYTGGTIGGAVTATSWGGTVGGIIALMSNGDLTISGSLRVNGVNASSYIGATGGGFRGGTGVGGTTNPLYAYSGEGNSGTQLAQREANGNAGGGGKVLSSGNSGGGGGGNGTAGSDGTGAGSSSSSYGLGGSVAGNAGLTTILFGGAGGGSVNDSATVTETGGGASSGGIIIIFAKTITISGSVTVNGANGYSSTESAGASSAGGSILLKCQTAVLGTNKITATGGSTIVNSGGNGGAGGVGRIHVDYSDTISGTTNPTLDSTQVTSLKAQIYGGMI